VDGEQLTGRASQVYGKCARTVTHGRWNWIGTRSDWDMTNPIGTDVVHDG
jgi:hypothetical protein